MNANAPQSNTLRQATFGGGCFWCLEPVFRQLQGVIEVESGYCNGQHPAPSHEDVCTGTTGHAEVVKVRFDAGQISFHQLLEVFFTIHDPTSLNRQGHDEGTQYRSGIYAHDEQQAHEARALIEQLDTSHAFGQPIVTEVRPVANYHPAEADHQRYFEQNPDTGYCALVVGPKVAKFQKTFADLLKVA